MGEGEHGDKQKLCEWVTEKGEPSMAPTLGFALKAKGTVERFYIGNSMNRFVFWTMYYILTLIYNKTKKSIFWI